MPRITLPSIIPVVLVLGAFGLFMHSWTSPPPAEPPPPTTMAWREAMHPDSAIGAPAEPPATNSLPPPGAATPPGGPEPPQ
jgi:hypothetical protein